MEAQSVAKTITQQLIGTVGKTVLMSWGLEDIDTVNEANLKSLGINNSLGAIKLKVSGRHHKGHVLVVLTHKDLYDVYICEITDDIMKVKEKAEDMFFDEFGSWIDEQVELVDTYVA